ncbi:chloride channel protein [Acidaminobacter hydrogenoformans]|uniref:H+/Cl-antiporter ClcA n=1 Tax=Acidaminobacter hydrogenoformans DSM 2784 TaxID=1120920 RepID=A0A1G5S1J5_9FIRM|nr:chloride channel protein [Acidaminobacter hydrogenoformans]SCZ80018.1 H+/Cl-antiporter ClcA [Acidaminobacter hydrogenoformans DSM 2784]
MRIAYKPWHQCLLAGIFIGLSISLFKILLLDWDVFTRLTTGDPVFYVGVLLASAVLMQYFKLKYPMIRGSGCPQLKGVLLNQLEMKPAAELPLKFSSVVLMNGLGLSAGSAGPAIQLGAYFGQLILKGKKNNDFLLSCAMTAFAVLYGVPMAAIAFGIEEYQMKLKAERLFSLTFMMATALGIRLWLFGTAPTLRFKMETYPSWQGLGFLIAASLLVGLTYKITQLWLGRLYRWRPLIFLPFLMTFYFSKAMPKILGGGILLFDLMAERGATLLLGTAVALLAGKIIFSLFCLSSGVPAGVFLPTLAIGGILGSVTALVSIEYFSEAALAYNAYIVLGIALVSTVILRRPFTGALLAAELTGNYGWIPYLLVLSLIVNGMLIRTGDKPLNEALLEKLLDEDKEIDY